MKELKGQRWGVVGAGKSGLASARFLLAREAAVLMVDDDPKRLQAAAQDLGGQIEFRPADAVLATDASGWILSPGVPPSHALVAAALQAGNGYSDLDLWQAHRQSLTIAVTGTNGKSTVTRLIAAQLRAAGRPTIAGGNLGRPIGDMLGERAAAAVLEVSSFQLCYAQHFRPEIAVLTNLAPDHLDWHPDAEHYAQSKYRMFRRLDAEGLAVLPRTLRDEVPVAAGAMAMTFGTEADADVRVGDEAVEGAWARQRVRVPVPAALAAGPMRLNLAAAVGAGLATGLKEAAMAQGAADFVPLKYRFQLTATHTGVRYVNDSKATNLHALVAAVQAAGEHVHLLVGGKRKGLDWASVRGAIGPHLQAVYAYGECRDDVAAAWNGLAPLHVHETLGEAIKAAHAAAARGDTVLLAPGTSSFDQFSGYEERGKHFDLVVGALVKDGGGRR